jgi:hypothetical protein
LLLLSLFHPYAFFLFSLSFSFSLSILHVLLLLLCLPRSRIYTNFKTLKLTFSLSLLSACRLVYSVHILLVTS